MGFLVASFLSSQLSSWGLEKDRCCLLTKLLFKDFIYLLLERGKGRERNINMQETRELVVSCLPPAGNPAHNPGMCPEWESNWWLLGSQDSPKSTEPHQLGHQTGFNRAGANYVICSQGHDHNPRLKRQSLHCLLLPALLFCVEVFLSHFALHFNVAIMLRADS